MMNSIFIKKVKYFFTETTVGTLITSILGIAASLTWFGLPSYFLGFGYGMSITFGSIFLIAITLNIVDSIKNKKNKNIYDNTADVGISLEIIEFNDHSDKEIIEYMKYNQESIKNNNHRVISELIPYAFNAYSKLSNEFELLAYYVKDDILSIIVKKEYTLYRVGLSKTGKFIGACMSDDMSSSLIDNMINDRDMISKLEHMSDIIFDVIKDEYNDIFD